MALKDHFRKAIGRETRSPSTSTSSNHSTRPPTGTTTPSNCTETPLTSTSTNNTSHNITPAITLTKTPSRLTKTLTWRRNEGDKSKEEKKNKKMIDSWAKEDAEEWKAPKSLRPGRRKDQKCQDTLRAFDFGNLEREGVGGRRSVCSGISPSASRAGSMDDGVLGGRKRSSGAGVGVGPGKLSQEIVRAEGGGVGGHKQSVGTVQEE